MNNEMNNLIEAINSLILEMESLKAEINDLKIVSFSDSFANNKSSEISTFLQARSSSNKFSNCSYFTLRNID